MSKYIISFLAECPEDNFEVLKYALELFALSMRRVNIEIKQIKIRKK